MKAFLILAVWLFLLCHASGQGTVNFLNDSSTLSSPPDRLIRLSVCGPDPGATGTNLQVQLYYGAATASDNALIPVASAPARLRDSATTVPGTWSGGGFRTLTGFPFGSGYVKLQLRVWDITYGSTYEQAMSNPNCCGYSGVSRVFLYLIPQSASEPFESYSMANFEGFRIGPLTLADPYSYGTTNQTVGLGQKATLYGFWYYGSGAPGPTTFQWSFNGFPLPGATSNPLIISNAQPANGGNYSLTVSTQCGETRSESATLTVLMPRLAIRQPNPAQTHITWSTNLGSYLLESASNLAGASWETVTNTPAIQGTNYLLIEVPSSVQKFFRLRKS